MTSKFSNKFPIPEKFPEILHDYTREVVRYMPKDILDFSIQYFYSLEQNVPLKYIEGGSKDLPKLIVRETTPSLPTNQNTQNIFYKQNENPLKKTELQIQEMQEIKEIKTPENNNTPRDIDNSRHQYNIDMDNGEDKNNKTGDTFGNISASSSDKNGVINFVLDVFSESKKYAIENEKK